MSGFIHFYRDVLPLMEPYPDREQLIYNLERVLYWSHRPDFAHGCFRNSILRAYVLSKCFRESLGDPEPARGGGCNLDILANDVKFMRQACKRAIDFLSRRMDDDAIKPLRDFERVQRILREYR